MYRWFKAPADPAVYGEGQYYFVHGDTNESRWEEPGEPYWIFNIELQAADPEHGLQQPTMHERTCTWLLDLPPTALIELI